MSLVSLISLLVILFFSLHAIYLHLIWRGTLLL